MEITNKSSVLCSYPGIGSVWLQNCSVENGFVMGDAWDDSQVRASTMPDDYRGEPVLMNFPLSCIRKIINQPI
jgi:hypothetical protein